MNTTLVIILVLVVVVVAAVYLLPRLSGGRAGVLQPGGGPTGGAPVRRPDDPDHVDEASQVVNALGGEVRPGDAVSLHIDDPGAWGLNSFDLDLSVGAVGRAEIRDTAGVFSFPCYWMPADQEASVLMIEGDVLAHAEAFVGTVVNNQTLLDAVLWCRDQYLADTVNSEVNYDLSEHNQGTWTAFAAREGGTIRVESGTAHLLPAGAAIADGLPYRDATFYQGSRQERARLRLIEVGTYSYLLRGEVMPLNTVKFLRRTRPTGRA